MGYDRDDSFSFDFESNGIPFGSKSKEKLSPRPFPIEFERKWNTSFLSVNNFIMRQVFFFAWDANGMFRSEFFFMI